MPHTKAWLGGGWIPLNEQPPEVGKPMLGLNEVTGMQSVCELEYDGPLKRRFHRWYIKLPTHWRELPEGLPRKPDREDEGEVIVEFGEGARGMSQY